MRTIVAALAVLVGGILLERQLGEWPEVSEALICANELKEPRQSTCEGLVLQRTGQSKAAMDAYVRGAEPRAGVAPDAYAQYQLAVAFKEGYGGLPINNDAARQWLAKSAAQGNQMARRITHTGPVPSVVSWVLYSLLVEAGLLCLAVPAAAGSARRGRLSSLQLAYLTVPGLVAFSFGMAAKQSFYPGADILADLLLSIVAAACLGAGFTATLLDRASRADKLRSALEQYAYSNLTAAQEAALDSKINKIVGIADGKLTRWRLLQIWLTHPETLFISSLRK